MQKLELNPNKESDKLKLTESEVHKLAETVIGSDSESCVNRAIWIDGYRTSEQKHVKDVWKLRKVVKGYIHALTTMYDTRIDKNFIEDELLTSEDDHINSLIMSQASDIAEKLTELECKVNGITCYVNTIEGETVISSYTEEAQDIFNIYYDEQKTELYNLLNAQLKIIK